MCCWNCIPRASVLIKFVWKLLEIRFLLICVLSSGDMGAQCFGGGDIQQKWRVQTFWLAGGPTKSSPLVGHPNLPMKKTLERVFYLLTVIILNRARESIFFQINKFTACKFKDKKEVSNSLMAFNLLKIIHPFQGKKHLRTSET